MKLAVIVPVYNQENYLKENLSRALILQKNNNFTFYFVNDASTDNSLDIFKSFPELLVINLKQNSGQGIARQIGLKKAVLDSKNTHFAFLDGDDYYFIKAAEIMQKNIVAFPNKVIKYLFSSKLESDISFENYKVSNFKVKVVNDAPFLFMPSMVTYTIPRAYISAFQYKYHQNYKYEDGIISHSFLLKHYTNLKECNIPIFHYTQNPFSTTRDNHVTYLDDIFIALNALLDLNKNFKHQESLAYICINELLAHTYYVFLNKNYKLNKQIKKMFNFMTTRFSTQDLKSSYKQLITSKKILLFLYKYHLSFLYKPLLFVKQKLIEQKNNT